MLLPRRLFHLRPRFTFLFHCGSFSPLCCDPALTAFASKCFGALLCHDGCSLRSRGSWLGGSLVSALSCVASAPCDVALGGRVTFKQSFAIFLIGPWLEIDPSASEQFGLNEQFGPNEERLGVDLFLHGNLLFIGHSSLVGGEFSAVFLLGRRLHVSAGGFASPSRASAFNCGSRPA